MSTKETIPRCRISALSVPGVILSSSVSDNSRLVKLRVVRLGHDTHANSNKLTRDTSCLQLDNVSLSSDVITN